MNNTVQTEDFFIPLNAVGGISDDEYKSVELLVNAAMAFARITNHCVYIIDYLKQNFLFASDSLAYLCGESKEKIRELGYELYLKHVPQDELDMLLEINAKGFELFDTFPEEEKPLYSISYDFHLINGQREMLINHKITPLLLRNGRIWLAMCIITHSARKDIGYIRMQKHGCNSYFEYDRAAGRWEQRKEICLSDMERDVLRLLANGYKVEEIAEKVHRSKDAIKSCKRTLFMKLGVSNTIEALSYAENYKLL